jgi:hypothetical protein
LPDERPSATIAKLFPQTEPVKEAAKEPVKDVPKEPAKESVRNSEGHAKEQPAPAASPAAAAVPAVPLPEARPKAAPETMAPEAVKSNPRAASGTTGVTAIADETSPQSRPASRVPAKAHAFARGNRAVGERGKTG